MRKIIVYLSALVLGLTLQLQLFSQDIITLRNNYTIDAKNIIISPTKIVYQDYYTNDGSNKELEKNKVAKIKYENGSVVRISEHQTISSSQTAIGKNLISFHLLDFVISNFTLSYERIIADGKYGVQVPISLGYATQPVDIPIPPIGDTYANKLISEFYSGVSFNIYPTGQGTFKYFLGPAIRIGHGKYFTNWDNYSATHEEISTNYFKLLVNNGFVLTMAQSLSLSLVGSIGIQYLDNVDVNPTQTTGALSFDISFRF